MNQEDVISTSLAELKVNYKINPLGINIDAPLTFAWNMNSNLIGQKQASYRITVQEVSKPGAVIWDSEEQDSGKSVGIIFGSTGKAEKLKTQMRYIWTVTVKDINGEEYTAESFFETGADWSGVDWITIKDYSNEMRSLLFRTEQAIYDKEVTLARLYITGLGAYDAFINGIRIRGDRDFLLAPGWSDYKSYIHYQTYDVTDYIKTEKRTVTLSAIVGSGWYGSSIVDATAIGYDTILGEPEALERCLLAKLLIHYSDGTVQEIVTNPSNWHASSNSPYEQDGIYEGEAYNAQTAKTIEGWNCAGCDFSGWLEVAPLTYKGSVVAGSDGVIYDYLAIPFKSAYSYNAEDDIISHDDGSVFTNGEIDSSNAVSFKSGEIIKLKSGCILIADFEQNAAATVAMKVSAPAGTSIKMQPGECLSDGKDAEHIKGALIHGACEGRGFKYIASGNGVEDYRARFHFTGYQFLKITADADIKIHDLTSIAVSSVGEETGFVETSNKLLNQFIRNSKWSQISNFCSVPTDCPQREYYGWSGDAQLFSEAAMYHFDSAIILSNYIEIMNGFLRSYGYYASIMPKHVDSMYSKMIGAGWADAGIIIPWVMYTQTGDISLIMRYWEEMCKYTDMINANGYMLSHGDWNSGNERASMFYIMSCYAIHINMLMAKMAEALGYTDRAASYADLSEKKRRKTIEQYITQNGDVRSASADIEAGHKVLDSQNAPCIDNAQTALAWAILLKLYDSEEQRQVIINSLVDSVENKNQSVSADRGENTLATGFLGVHVLLPALSHGGRSDTAYDLMLNTSMYTFLYAVAHGATTIWESWDIWDAQRGYRTDNISQNHYSYGVASEWVYKYLIGIQKDVENPGFKHFIIQPQILQSHSGEAISYANGSYKSYYGRIVSNWSAENSKLLTYHCEIPANTTATLYLPVESDFKPGNIPYGVTFKEMTIRNGLSTAVFSLLSGCFNFIIANGVINVAVSR